MSERNRQLAFVPHGSAMTREIVGAEGAWLHGAGGERILDAAGGAIAVNVGHGRAEVADAVARALRRGSYVVPTFATPERRQLVERLVTRWLPNGIERCWFASGGSEAMDAALRLARQHHVSAGRTSRHKILGRELSYHGTTLATLAAGGHTKRRAAFEPMLPDWPKAPACYCFRCPLGGTYPSCGVACVDAIEEVILREGPETIAAVVAEPIVGSTAGALVPPDEYWPRLREICTRHGVLLVADEVMTGFGRTGKRFAVDHWDVVPDILVSGKGLAGTYAPMGGVFASDAVVAPMAEAGDDLMFYTYGAHPAAVAAANAVLEIMERERLVERAAELGVLLRERLAKLEGHPHLGDIRGRGLLQAVEIVEDRESSAPFPAEARMKERVVAAGFGMGVFLYPAGCDPARDVVCIGPPFVIGEPELDLIVSTLERSLDSAVGRWQKSLG